MAAARAALTEDDLRMLVKGPTADERALAAHKLCRAMDRDNLAYLHRKGPAEHRAKARLFLEFSTEAKVQEVPDPYYGRAEGFEHVLDLAEDANRGLVLSLWIILIDPSFVTRDDVGN